MVELSIQVKKNIVWKVIPLFTLTCVLASAQTFEIGGQQKSQPAQPKSAKSKTAASSPGLSWGASIDIERQSRAAEDALRRGDYAAATAFAEHAANAAPQDTRLWFLLGYAARLSGHFQTSINAYRRGLQNQPGAIDGLSGLAQTYARMGQMNQAKALLKQLLAANPHNADDLLFAGELFLQTGDTPEAIAFLSRSENVKPSTRAEILLAGAYTRLKQMDKARQYLLTAQRRNPNSPETVRALAGYYRDVKDYPNAIASLKRVAGKNPDILAELAYTYELAKDKKSSAETYARAANAAPKQINYQLSAAQSNVALEDIKQAQTFLQRAEALDPEHYRLHAIRGEIARMQNRTQDAIREYSQAVAAAPDAVPDGPLYPIQLRMTVSELYRDTGNDTAAREQASIAATKISALQVEPAIQTEYFRLRSSIKAGMGDNTGAEGDIKQALALDPGSSTTLVQYGSLLWKMKRPQESQKLFVQVVTADPSNKYALTSLGYLARELNDNKASEDYFQRLIRFYPQDSGAYLALGDLYTATRQFDAAENSYLTAYKWNRTNPMIIAGGANAGIESHHLDRTGKWLQRAVGPMNDHPFVMRERERYLTWSGNYLDAAKLGYKVIEKLPQDRDAVVYLGYSLLYLGRFDDLLRLTTKYEPLMKREAALPLLAGYVHRNGQLLDQAADAFSRAIERDPKVTTAYINRGYVLNDLQNSESAAKDFQSALKLEPGNGEAHLGLAYSYLQLRKPTLVLENADKAAKALGESKSTHLARAGGYREKLLLPQAEKEYRAALALDPNDSEIHMGLAQTLFGERHYAEAIQAYQEVLPLNDDNSLTYASMANAAAHLHRNDDARRYVAAAERTEGDNAAVLMATGETMLALGDNEAAMSRFEHALNAPDSTRVEVRLGFAKTFLSKGKWDDARQQVALAFAESRVGEGAPVTADNLVSAASIFQGMNDFDLAARYYEMARDAGADEKPVAIGLANTYLSQGEYSNARAELDSVGGLAENSADYDYMLAYANMNRQARNNRRALTSFARASELSLNDDSARRSLYEVAAEEGYPLNQMVSIATDIHVSPIFEDATVYALDAAVLGVSNAALLPPPRHSTETSFLTTYHVHFDHGPTLLGTYELRNARGQISFPSQSLILNQNTHDTNIGFGIKPAFRLGQSFVYLNPGIQFTIRRDKESPVELNQNLFRQYLYLSTSPLFNWLQVGGVALHESGPFTSQSQHSSEFGADLDFRVGRPWGRTAMLTGYRVRDIQLNPLIREYFSTTTYAGVERRFGKNLKTAILGEYIRSWRVQDTKYAIAQAVRPAVRVGYQPSTQWSFDANFAMTRGEGVHSYDNFETGALVSYTRSMRRHWNDGVGSIGVEYPLKFSFGIQQQSFMSSTGNAHGAFVPVVRLTLF